MRSVARSTSHASASAKLRTSPCVSCRPSPPRIGWARWEKPATSPDEPLAWRMRAISERQVNGFRLQRGFGLRNARPAADGAGPVATLLRMALWRLNTQEAALLRQVVAKHDPSVSSWVEPEISDETLTEARAARLLDVIGEELAETGFDEDDKATERGLHLESLIRKIQRLTSER
jgi:hypothetical protein